MNQKSVPVFNNEVFRHESLPFNQLPSQSRLFMDFLEDSDKIKDFYPEKQTPLKKYAAKVLAEYKVDRAALCNILVETNKEFGAGNKTFENIELLRRDKCLTVVTGQQAGLFSGAIYTIYKALSAIKFAEHLRKENIEAVPVFWIAEEDHDFDEVKKTFNLDKTGKLFEVENTPESYIQNTPVGFVQLDASVKATQTELFDAIPHTEFTVELKKLISTAYQKGATYSSSFARLLTALFADYGLIILSPLNKNLKKLSAPIFNEAVKKSDAIAAALIKRNSELKESFYQPQVLAEENFFPFFLQNENGERQALRRNLQNGKIKIQTTKRELELTDLLEITQLTPESLSPNALMRPIVQDFLLPTLTYYGGAAEVAYFAQNSIIYEILNRPVTPIRNRASFTVCEPSNRRTLEKYRLSFTDLFAGIDDISARIIEEILKKGTAEVFNKTVESINDQLDQLESELISDEPTLATNLSNRRKKILWHIEALRKKYHRAAMQKDEDANRRIQNLFTALLPHNALQERTLNIITFLNLYGPNFIDWLYDAVEPQEENHRILYL